jgi:cytochrome c oxidase subunit IV
VSEEGRVSDEVVAIRTYVLVCAALVILTVLTIVLAQVDLRGWNTMVGLAIAAAQAILSAVFFMHLRWSRPMTRLVALVALLWLGILVVGTMDDILTRGWLAVPGK